MSVPICSEVSRNSGQNHRDGTRARVRESGHVPSRFPSRDARPECPDWAEGSKCLETRCTEDGFKRRRYLRADGVRITTIEVPMSVWKSLNRTGRAKNRFAEWTRERKREATRLRAVELVRAGWKRIAVASELGVPLRTVQGWTKGLAVGVQS